MPKNDLLFVLESALRSATWRWCATSAAIAVLPLAEAVGAGSVDSRRVAEPGYGVTVVPLQYVSAPDR